jgi:surface protein
MSDVFESAFRFNQPIGHWNTRKVKDMSFMFSGAGSFDNDIGRWRTENVEDMRCMFFMTREFNRDIGNWDTGSVVNMHSMFESSTKFNGGIGRWNTKTVTNMRSMFSNALAFNRDIGNWNTGNVTDMRLMFCGASAFDRDLSRWDLGRCAKVRKMFHESPISEQNKPLIGIRIACGSNSGAPSIGQACRLWGGAAAAAGQAPCEGNCSVGSMRPGSMCRLAVVVVPGDEDASAIDVKLNATVFRSLVGPRRAERAERAERANSADGPGGREYSKYIGELNGATRKWMGQYPALKKRRLAFSVYPSDPALHADSNPGMCALS